MNKKEKQLQESTSHISNISYDIENWLSQGIDVDTIRKRIEKMQDKDNFLENLILADAFFDEESSIGVCAFLDTNTGQTIVGFAGTNKENDYLEGDIVADIKIGIGGGFDETSKELEEVNNFIKKLQAEGHNITQTTGHSLGGAYAAYIALFHDIPYSITYNPAPLYVLFRETSPSDIAGSFKNFKLDDLIANYDGKMIRFVSENDSLDFGADLGNGKYIGKEFLLQNGKGHDMEEFLKYVEQEYILSTLLSEGTFGVNNLKITFDKSNLENKTVELKPQDLFVKNLWGTEGKYSGRITINPEAFENLKVNLTNTMAGSEIEWIISAIHLCKEKNDGLKNTQSSRDENLANGIVDGLVEAGLTKLLGQLEKSHGELILNKQTLMNLGGINKDIILQKFNGSKRWLLDGEHFSKSEVNSWITEMQDRVDNLYYEITGTGEFHGYLYRSQYREPVYQYQTISEISEAFVNLANILLKKTEKVFEGKGKRFGKTDGIVDAISEVLDSEEKNIGELTKQIQNVGNIAGTLAINFSGMDEWLSKNLQSGQAAYEFIEVPSSYKAYLEENNIFDDVVDVIEAYDLQGEEASRELAEKIICDYEELINLTRNKLNKMYDMLEDFKEAINKLDRKLKGKVTTIELGETTLHGYNDYRTEEIKKSHGLLADFFETNIRTDISNVKNKIFPIIDDFDYLLETLNIYKSVLYEFEGHLSTVVEKAIYDTYELGEIINAQKLITIRINIMVQEIKKIDADIEAQFKGKSIDSYQEQLQAITVALNYFNIMIEDCFGKNLK